MDEETQQAVEDIMSGNLAQRIKDNTKYALTGFAIGAVLGIVIATLTGKCRIYFGLAGGLAGGITGAIISKNKQNDKQKI